MKPWRWAPLALLPLGLVAGTPERGSVLIATTFFVLVLSIALRMRSEGDRSWLVPVIMAGFIAKVAASVASYLAIKLLFNGKGDAVGYHTRAIEAADIWRRFDLPATKSFTGTSFMDLATSFLFVPYEPTLLGGFILFGMIGFLGQLLMYAAFRRGVPSGRLGVYAGLILFYPSIVYWTSPISKEALMFLFIGLIVYGAARMLEDLRIRWVLLMAIGLAPAVMLRVHVAALLGASLFGAVLFMTNPPGRGVTARRLLSLVLATVALSGLVVAAAADFNIDLSAAASGEDIGAELTEFTSTVESNTSKGDSAVEGGFVTNPAQLPGAVVRVLYRPFPWEADNAPEFVTALEGFVLMVLTVIRFPLLWRGSRELRRHPFLLMSLFYSLGFTLAFSGILNLGLMARQRAQLLPFFLALLIQLPAIARQRTDEQKEAERRKWVERVAAVR